VSGYSFHCTPCGFAHPGECDPSVAKKTAPVDLPRATQPLAPQQPGRAVTTSGPQGQWTATIAVGSRWRLEHQFPNTPHWQQVGWPDGYEVMAIVASGFSVAIQMREWGSKVHPIYTCSMQWWEPDGNGASNGGYNRFVVWS
jgi:hypothetical protein